MTNLVPLKFKKEKPPTEAQQELIHNYDETLKKIDMIKKTDNKVDKASL